MNRPALSKLWIRVQPDSGLRLTPDDVADACVEFCDLFPNAEYGAAHVVISDFNTESEHIASCLMSLCDEMATGEGRNSFEALHFLSCLLKLDDNERIVHGREDDRLSRQRAGMPQSSVRDMAVQLAWLVKLNKEDEDSEATVIAERIVEKASEPPSWYSVRLSLLGAEEAFFPEESKAS